MTFWLELPNNLLIYRAHAIVSRGLYTFYPILEERFVIKSGL